MAPCSPVAPELIRAIAHPVRLRIFSALDRRPLTVAELTAALGADRRRVQRHLQHMERAGLVRRATGPDGPVFEMITAPHLSDAEYGELPVAMRRASAAVALARIQATATSALGDGGFDRDDIHLSRTALTVDDKGWQRLGDELADALERLDMLSDDGAPAPAGDDSVRATVVMMLYANPEPCPAVAQAAAFPREDALLRAWDLNEDLADLLVPAEGTDWAAVIEHADRLRVVASAALAAEQGRGEPHAEPVATAAD